MLFKARQLLRVVAWLWLCYWWCKLMKKILTYLNPKVEYIQKNLFEIEIIGFIIFLAIGIIIQIVDKGCSGALEAKLTFLQNYNMEKILEVVERYAVIVGGASFFLQKWAENDTQNIVYALSLVFTMIVSRLCFIISLNIISLSITIFNLLAVLLCMFCLVHYCLLHSKELNKKYAGE